jgi:antitoxin component YwqK of YwqJK toxin-antitoxin module
LIPVWRETGEKLSESIYKNGKLKGLHKVWNKKGKKLENRNNTSVNSSLSEEVKAEADAAFLKQNYKE